MNKQELSKSEIAIGGLQKIKAAKKMFKSGQTAIDVINIDVCSIMMGMLTSKSEVYLE